MPDDVLLGKAEDGSVKERYMQHAVKDRATEVAIYGMDLRQVPLKDIHDFTFGLAKYNFGPRS